MGGSKRAQRKHVFFVVLSVSLIACNVLTRILLCKISNNILKPKKAI